MSQDPSARRYVFWHQQDEAHAFGGAYADLHDQITGTLRMNWGGDGAFTVAQIEFAIALCGATDRLRVEWDGSESIRIAVERYVPQQS